MLTISGWNISAECMCRACDMYCMSGACIYMVYDDLHNKACVRQVWIATVR